MITHYAGRFHIPRSRVYGQIIFNFILSIIATTITKFSFESFSVTFLDQQGTRVAVHDGARHVRVLHQEQIRFRHILRLREATRRC